MPAYKILLMGASYGSLLASKMLFGGHSIHLVCLPAEADLINAEGFKVRLPVRGRQEPVLLESRKLPGKVTAGGAAGVNPGDYDLVGLCMQEPQYRSAGVRELLDAVGKSRVPCMSIMNMPPLPYVKRIPGLDHAALEAAYTDPRVWDSVDPKKITLNSPDPQAIRPKAVGPFEKSAAAALSLSRPASAARALFNGAPNIERCDKLVQLIAKQKGLSHPVIDANVALTDELLAVNRKKAAA